MSRLFRMTWILLLACLVVPSSAARISRDLQERVAKLPSGETLPVILEFAERVDLSRFHEGRASASQMIVTLRETANRSQARVLTFLRSQSQSGSVRSFWINNSVAVEVTPRLLTALGKYDEIESIEYDEPVAFPDVGTSQETGRGTYWNLNEIRIPEVWSTYGLDGTGIVIGSMDTGVDITHPALLGKWRGGDNSWIDLVNGYPEPYDDHGHGTHTIGTLVGGDGDGPFPEDIGIAYGAKFISAKVLDANNSFSSASIVIAGAQWMLDPDGNPLTNDFPNVINNSWYFYNQTYSGYHSTMDAWCAAAIIPVFCIGNEGPASATTRPPGNYNNVIGVGATDSGDVIAYFSSRGPSPSGPAFPPDLRKPDISGPGVSVRSSLPGGTYASWSGTSMASPHVAGTIALMLQGNPRLTYDAIRERIFQTAVDLGAAGYDYDYGYGRLDAFEAVRRSLADVTGTVTATDLRLAATPNPFSYEVRLDYTAGASGAHSLEIFDVQGRRIWSSTPSEPAGSLFWDGRDTGGRALPDGLYLARLVNAGRTETRLLLLLR